MSSLSSMARPTSQMPLSVTLQLILLLLAPVLWMLPTTCDAFAYNMVGQRSGCMTELDTTEIIMNNKVVPASQSDFPNMRLVIVHAKEQPNQHNVVEIELNQTLPFAVWIRLLNPYDELTNIQYVLETKSTRPNNKASFAEIGGCEDNKRAAGTTGPRDLGIFYRIEEWPDNEGEFHVWGGWAGGHERVRLVEPLIFRRPPKQQQQQQQQHETSPEATIVQNHDAKAVTESEQRHNERSAEEVKHESANHENVQVHQPHAEEQHHAGAHSEEHRAEEYHHAEEHQVEERRAEAQHVQEHAKEEHHHHQDEQHHHESIHQEHRAQENKHAEERRYVEEHHEEAIHHDHQVTEEEEEEEEAEAAEHLQMEEELGDDTEKQEEMAHDSKTFEHDRLKELGERLAAFRDGNWHALPLDLKKRWSPEEFRRLREERNFGHPKHDHARLTMNDRFTNDHNHDHNSKERIQHILDRFKDRRMHNKFDLLANRHKHLLQGADSELQEEAQGEEGQAQPPPPSESSFQSWQERYESENFGEGGPFNLQQYAYGAIFFVVSNVVVMQLCLMTSKRDKGRRDM